MQHRDGNSLVMGEMAARVLVAIEQRGSRRGRGRRSCSSNCSGRVTSLIVASFAQAMSISRLHWVKLPAVIARAL